jgi:hypothetical protein
MTVIYLMGKRPVCIEEYVIKSFNADCSKKSSQVMFCV